MDSFFMNTYHRLPVTFVRGDGAWLWDTKGKKYLDFSSGIAVNSLGHGHPALVKALREQAGKLIHVCNYYQSDTAIRFAERLIAACSRAGMKKLFLANSGAEANEGAVKLARKYSLKKYGPGRHRIVTLKGSFHGRTVTALSATGQEKFHKDFGPFTEGFAFIPGGDVEALNRTLDKSRTTGLLLEAIQGESGIVPQSPEFIAEAARLCAERDILLMFDEVQCGTGRTGAFLACEHYGVKPDVVTLAKGLAGGVPIGVFLAGEKVVDILESGDHGSTFGGNPLAAAGGLAVLETVDNPAFLAEISRKGEKIISIIKSWNHPKIKEVRGRGLMTGVDIEDDAGAMLGKALEAGLLVLSAGLNTLRFLPPYIISDAEIEQGLKILRGILCQ